MGGEIRFGSRASKFLLKDGLLEGVDVEYIEEEGEESKRSDTLRGDAVVLATGHSARDIYEELHESGVQLEAKGFAVGFRIEHPQSVINDIQYGKEWGERVVSWTWSCRSCSSCK